MYGNTWRGGARPIAVVCQSIIDSPCKWFSICTESSQASVHGNTMGVPLHLSALDRINCTHSVSRCSNAFRSGMGRGKWQHLNQHTPYHTLPTFCLLPGHTFVYILSPLVICSGAKWSRELTWVHEGALCLRSTRTKDWKRGSEETRGPAPRGLQTWRATGETLAWSKYRIVDCMLLSNSNGGSVC